MKLPELLPRWLQSAVGRKLLTVKGSFHVFNSERNQFGDEFEFFFEEGQHGKIFGNSDGASLRFSFDPADEFDMQEYGAAVVFCVSNDPCFVDVVGRQLVSAFAVVLSIEDVAIGVQLQFSENKKLSILNLGDELFVFNEVPEDLINEEKLIFIPVA